MNGTVFILAAALLGIGSCSKKKNDSMVEINKVSRKPDPPQPNSQFINNPIKGKWELGAFKMLCAGTTDTIIYTNERGDYIDFRKNDTAYYIYNTTSATGWSPYQLLNETTFILNGDTARIISFDGIRLTTFTKAINGGAKQWMTYKKVSN